MRAMLRQGCARAFILALAVATPSQALCGEPLAAAEISAEPPSNLIVTVYRAPYRDTGSIQLNALAGFALVSETRTVRLPAGLSRVRFEGVADGIEPASAIITGFPGGVIEKNRDARLLSPEALIAAAVGKPVELLRTIRKTGQTERLTGTILSDAGAGVIFKSAQGIEALRCSGLPETFSFEPVAGLSATADVVRRGTQPQRRDRAGHSLVPVSRLRLGCRLHRDPVAGRQEHGFGGLGHARQFQRRWIPVGAYPSGGGQGEPRERRGGAH